MRENNFENATLTSPQGRKNPEGKKTNIKKNAKTEFENRTQETPILQVFFLGLGHFHVLGLTTVGVNHCAKPPVLRTNFSWKREYILRESSIPCHCKITSLIIISG